MGAGRKPKPTALKLLTGNAGKRPLNDAEPVTDPLSEEPPDWLSAEAVYFWQKLLPVMSQMHVAQESDRFALGNLCMVLAAIRGAQDTFDYKAIPALMGQATRLMAEFGLTPSSRTKVKQLATRDEVDPFEKYLSGGGEE
jgi:phage terminase small subunit